MDDPAKMQTRLQAAFGRQAGARAQSVKSAATMSSGGDAHEAFATAPEVGPMDVSVAKTPGIRRLSIAAGIGAALALWLGARNGPFLYFGALAGFLAAASLVGFVTASSTALSGRRLRLFSPAKRSKASKLDHHAFALLGEVHDGLGDIAITRDLDGRILYANDTFQRATACLSPHGLSCADLGLALNPSGIPYSGDIEIETAFDRRIYVWRDAIIRDPLSGMQFMQSIACDVTRLRQHEGQREAAGKAAEAQNFAKSQLLATVSHEIRTPLNGILGMAHLLDRTTLQPAQHSYLDGIRRSGEALEQLVNDLLDLSALEAGRLTSHPIAAAPRQLLEGVVEMLAHRAHEKGIEVAIAVSPTVPEMMDFDAARLRQVFFNVIGNAIKFTATGGVLIEVKYQRGDLVVSVADTGPGMSASEQQKIFEEFTQAGTEHQKSGGTGLGLAISAKIMQEFGGTLSVDSKIGQGSTFTISLPLSDAAAVGSATDRSHILSHASVLLLAPDGPAAQAVTSTIRMLGGRCQLAVSRAEASMFIDRMRFSGGRFTDVIVDHRRATDFDAEIAARLNRSGPAPRKIFLVNPEARAALVEGAFDAWLIRPLREQTLIDMLLGRLRGIEQRGEPEGFAPAEAHLGSTRPQNLLVLVADDDPVNRQLSRSVLQRAGHEVRVAEDFTGLLAEISATSARRPDAIITDLNMPGGDGLAMLARIRRLERVEGRACVPLIVLTGDGSETVRRQAICNGADRILVKPIRPVLLLQTLDELTSEEFRVSKTQKI